MLGSLITRPLRLATRAVTLPYRTTRGAVDIAEGLVGLVALRLRQRDDSDRPNVDHSSTQPPTWRPPAPNETAAPESARFTEPGQGRPAPVNGNGASTSSGPAAAPPPPPPPPPAPTADTPEIVDAQIVDEPPAPPAPATPSAAGDLLSAEPVHITEEVELVDASADPGAEDGAGAQIRIAEPWEGYRSMKAADVIDRLASASREELATVELFEMTARNRKSVIAAAQRALKQASPPS
jgi:hypothetical protein